MLVEQAAFLVTLMFVLVLDGFANHRLIGDPQYSRNIRVTKTLVQTGFHAFSIALGESLPRSFPTGIQLRTRSYTSVVRSAACERDPASHGTSKLRYPSVDTALEGCHRLPFVYLRKTLTSSTLGLSPYGTCIHTSRGAEFATLSS